MAPGSQRGGPDGSISSAEGLGETQGTCQQLGPWVTETERGRKGDQRQLGGWGAQA